MTFIDTYKTYSSIDINGKRYFYFDLNKLANHFKFNLSLLPFSIKILLENLIRNEDGELITADMINLFCSQLTNKDKSFEIAFFPTRVLMQDFTGVPAVADLAAMRDALKTKNIDPNKINPLSRVDLIIDHSVMVDFFGSPDALENQLNLKMPIYTDDALLPKEWLTTDNWKLYLQQVIEMIEDWKKNKGWYDFYY